MQSWSRVRASLYGLWGWLPGPMKDLLVYLGAPKVTVGVTAVVLDSQMRLLLVHHTYRRPAWGLPSGLVRRNELATVALRRELREELGLTASVEGLLWADHEPRRHVLTLHYRVAVSGMPHHDVETDDHCYANLDELPDLVGWPAPWWLRAAVSSEPWGRDDPRAVSVRR